MNKLIACALLGLGLTQSLVACGDDDDSSGNTAGSAGTSAGTDTGGKNTGGAPTAGNGGKVSGGNANGGGDAGKAGGGKGGMSHAGEGAGGENLGGETAGGSGGAGAGGDDAVGGGGAGGEGGAMPEAPVQTPTPRWLEKYCDAKADDTLGCEGSPPWFDCFSTAFGYLSGEGGDASGFCETDNPEAEEWPNTMAMIAALDALAAACPSPKVEDWRCNNLSQLPEPKDATCREAEAARVQAYMACVP